MRNLILLFPIALTVVMGCTQTDLLYQIEEVIATVPEADVAVAVRDPSTGFVMDYRADSVFHAASTMKVPVLIEIYRRAAEQRLSLDDSLTVKNEFRSIVDNSLFSIEDDTDDAIYERLGEQMSVGELIHQMMSVSSNLATNLLIDILTADSVQNTVDNLGAPGMKVLRGVEDIKAYELGLSNSTTARALADILVHLMQGTAVSASADSAMIATMMHSGFDDMVPAGLPEGIPIANKTGTITRIHHDGSIVFPPDQPPYVIAILIRGVDDHSVSGELGGRIAAVVHEALRGSEYFCSDRPDTIRPERSLLQSKFPTVA